MNMFDEARTISAMLKMKKMTQSEIGKKLGVSQSYIANKLRLLKLSDTAKAKIIDTGLCERQARQLLRLTDEKVILGAIDIISERKMTVAESEALVDMLVTKEAPKRLSRLDRLDRISAFMEFIDESLKSLSAIGIETDKHTELYNEKRYITIRINEA